MKKVLMTVLALLPRLDGYGAFDTIELVITVVTIGLTTAGLPGKEKS